MIVILSLLGAVGLGASFTAMISIRSSARNVYVEPTTLRLKTKHRRRPVFVAWGDSHTEALVYLLKDLSKEYNVFGRTIITVGNAPLRNTYLDYGALGPSPEEQKKDFEAALRLIRDLDVPNVIIAARWDCHVPRWAPHLSGPKRDAFIADWRSHWLLRDDYTEEPPTIETSSRIFRRSLEETLRALDGRRVFFVMQAPVMDGWCADQPVTYDDYRLQQAEVTSCLADLRSLSICPIVLGPGKWWFKDGLSVIRDQGGKYYADRDHVGAYGAEKLYRPLLEPVFKTFRRRPRCYRHPSNWRSYSGASMCWRSEPCRWLGPF